MLWVIVNKHDSRALQGSMQALVCLEVKVNFLTVSNRITLPFSIKFVARRLCEGEGTLADQAPCAPCSSACIACSQKAMFSRPGRWLRAIQWTFQQ